MLSIRALPALLLLSLLLPARAAEPPTRGLRYPSLTPDGKIVVFAYRGDIWSAATDGSGQAQRLTMHEEQDTLPRVSPDGKWIAFSSRRNGAYDLYVLPIEGGVPRQVTWHSGPEVLCAWSPDGKRLLFMSNREPGMYQLDLYEVDVAGGTPRRITRDGGREGSYSRDGKSVVYVRGFNPIYQDNYQGSANFDIYVTDMQGGTPRRLTDTAGNERYPFFSADGQTVCFLAEENGVANFYAMPAAGGERRKVTKLEGEDIQRPDLGADGKTAVFERAGLLFRADLSAAEVAVQPLAVQVRSDVRNSGIETRTITAGGEQVGVSRDGTQLAFALRGDIWILPSSGGNGRQVTGGPSNDQWPRFSPDGRFLAYSSETKGNSDLFLLDLANGRSRQVTNHAANDFFQAWSPDGTKLVFSSERTGNRDIFVVELESGRETQLTNHPAADDDPVFSPDGSWIAFDSGREGGQAIFVMRADGSQVRRVTQGSGFFQVPNFSPDGSMLSFEAFNPATGDSDGLFAVAASGGPHVQISRDGQSAFWSPKGDFVYFHATRAEEPGIWRVRAPESVEAGQRVPFLGRIEVDRRNELAELFDEAWTKLRDGFYDPKMHGVDWNAMRAKYRDMAIDSENKDEFYNVVSQMLAELGASHLGIGRGPGSEDPAAPRGPETGCLGVEFEAAPAEGGGRKVARVLGGGPGDRAGLRVGDVVVAINSQRLAPESDLDRLLAGTAGREIPLTFRPLSEQGLGAERTQPVTPLPLMALYQISYQQWVARNAEMVKGGSQGRAGYIHLNMMNPENLARFQQAVARWNQDPNIKGMILDVRENGGGNIHEQLMQILTARPFIEVRPRGAPQGIRQPQLYWDKPVVLLINERSFSDAEVFPWAFRWLKVGKVVGVPTARGVIGTNDINLADGSTFRIPRTGMFGIDGTNLEGRGCEPDILVVETPEDRLGNRDPQLQKAIEVLLQEVAGREQAKEPPKESPPAKPGEPPAKPETPPHPPAGGSNEDPLRDAAAGEWVRYQVLGPAGAGVVRVTVEKIAEGQVFFTRVREAGEGTLPPIPDRVRQAPLRDSLPAYGKVLGYGGGNCSLGDKSFPVFIVDLKWPDGQSVRLYFSNQVAATGLLLVEVDGKAVLRATEWGGPGADSRPGPTREK